MSNPLVKIVDTVYIVFFIVLYLYKLENLASYKKRRFQWFFGLKMARFSNILLQTIYSIMYVFNSFILIYYKYFSIVYWRTFTFVQKTTEIHTF
jgi:hypothetical protein